MSSVKKKSCLLPEKKSLKIFYVAGGCKKLPEVQSQKKGCRGFFKNGL